MKTPEAIISLMMSGDAYSKALGMDVIEIAAGKCRLSLKVEENMVNGFNIAHGGIAYALADSAMAFAANSHGLQCVSIESSISHLKKGNVHDQLTAYCSEVNRNNKTGVYTVSVTNQNGELVAHFKGMVLISDREW